ncbi:MAG: hypothetical protein A2Y86_08405 [Candidatus Aminicenantes bacterium RBG_13_62_12]|nr:MAG: hypothetical protein A2Y86_08405 [Candidatus Aminicenantes bacterium RBG_13_62_12]
MRRSLVIFAALGLASACLSVRAAGPAIADDLLKIEAAIRPKSLSRGEEGKLVLRVLTSPGISLSPHPSFTIELAPCPELVFPKGFYTHSDLDIEVLEEGGEKVLNMTRPVEIPFTVNLQAKRGSHILQGKVKYFATSRKEGWCLKNTAKFSVSFSTRQLSIR